MLLPPPPSSSSYTWTFFPVFWFLVLNFSYPRLGFSSSSFFFFFFPFSFSYSLRSPLCGTRYYPHLLSPFFHLVNSYYKLSHAACGHAAQI